MFPFLFIHSQPSTVHILTYIAQIGPDGIGLIWVLYANILYGPR
jgi:hypothetical protein